MKRRVATEIVTALQKTTGRFLRKDKQANGVWREMSTEEAIQKAMQVIRDYKRPDRVALRGAGGQNGARKRRHCQESTPMDILQNIPPAPLYAIDDNPHKVSESDVLCGRGAFVNGHSGNQRLRDLAIKRKAAFDAGSFTDKQQLASEIVNIIRNLHPPGRFLKRPVKLKGKPLPRGLAGEWEELSDALAIHKACQIMRDISKFKMSNPCTENCSSASKRSKFMTYRQIFPRELLDHACFLPMTELLL